MLKKFALIAAAVLLIIASAIAFTRLGQTRLARSTMQVVLRPVSSYPA